MELENLNRTRIVGLRMTVKEYGKIHKNWKASTCRKLSDYIRRSLFDKPIVTTYRDQSLNDLMAEAIVLRNDLKSIGNNFNQAVKKLHTLHQIPEFKNWILIYETDEKLLLKLTEEIKNHIEKLTEKWLQ